MGSMNLTPSEFAEMICDTIASALGPTEAKVQALEAQVAELEARPTGLHYCGVWREGTSYRKDSGTTHAGSLWVATSDCPGEPGSPNSGWQLCCKRGRDGRDAR